MQSETHYQKYAIQSCINKEDNKKFSIGKETPLSNALFPFSDSVDLFDISEKELKEISYIKLNDEQKAGIANLYGNPTKVERSCPFQVLSIFKME